MEIENVEKIGYGSMADPCMMSFIRRRNVIVELAASVVREKAYLFHKLNDCTDPCSCRFQVRPLCQTVS